MNRLDMLTQSTGFDALTFQERGMSAPLVHPISYELGNIYAQDKPQIICRVFACLNYPTHIDGAFRIYANTGTMEGALYKNR